MKEELVKRDTAILAKEKGFTCDSSDCHWSYLDPNGMAMQYNEGSCVLIPSQALLQKWLREEHGLHIFIGLDLYGDEPKTFWLSLEHMIHGSILNIDSNPYKTYEEALESGLQEALKLIKP